MLVARDRVALSIVTGQWLGVVTDRGGPVRAVGQRHCGQERRTAPRVPQGSGRPHHRGHGPHLGTPLVSADEKIRAYPHLRTIW